MKKNLMVLLMSSLLVLAFALAGCGGQENAEGGDSQPEQAEQGKANLYISGPEPMLLELEKGFEKERGDVVDVLHMGCGPLAQKVHTEAEAGDVAADIIWGAEPSLYIQLQQEGLLEQYTSPEAANLKEECQIGDGYYTVCSSRYGVIAYNQDKVAKQEIPNSWNDLQEGYWKKRLAMADAGQSATALALTAGLTTMNDGKWDYIKGLKANEVMLTQQNNQAVERVATGEVDVAIVPHDGVLRGIKKDKKVGVKSKLAIAWPAEGSISIQRPIAIIADEKRSDANLQTCQQFIDFVISPEAQTIMNKYGFISVRDDVEMPAGVPKDIKSINLDWGKIAADADQIRSNFENIMLAK
ncbi:MAG: extracellular solute-binding protein [Bacillota bacterium]|nr:extracellular solute-binding protein [Bacillota bacterium]